MFVKKNILFGGGGLQTCNLSAITLLLPSEIIPKTLSKADVVLTKYLPFISEDWLPNVYLPFNCIPLSENFDMLSKSVNAACGLTAV